MYRVLEELRAMSISDELRSRLLAMDVDTRLAYETTIAKLSDLGITTESDLFAALEQRSEARLLACWTAGELRRHTTLPLLWRIIEGDAAVALEAAKAVLKLCVDDLPSTIARFATLLASKDREPASRIAVAYALGHTDQTAIDGLVATLADAGDHPAVRAHCAEALGALRARSAVPSLIEALNDVHPEVRYWSAYALGEIRDSRATSALQHLVDHDSTIIDGVGSVSDEAHQALLAIDRPDRGA
jgi:HEAT repeat protein